jgi:sirohydrochlorin cobaltochelatase
MNCQMCKYRTQVLGFEAEVGAPQESHHHHVEGIGTAEDCAFCDGVCNGLCKAISATARGLAHHHHGHGHHHHDHPHTHAPYPHADHPLGPRSMAKK